MAKRLTKRTINRIHQLRIDGLSGPKISKAVGRSLVTVYKVLKARPGAAPGTAVTANPRSGMDGMSVKISEIVQREVEARLMTARDVGIKALTAALKV
jgi:hypothetical protein